MGFLGRLIAKPIFLKLGKGLRSKKKQLCLGEELDLELDDSIIGKDNVTGPTTSKPQSFARWTDSGGTRLTDSKTTQDNDGNTATTNEYAGELTQLLDNLSANDEASVLLHLRSLVKTMIRQEIKEKQIWDAYIDTTSKSYVVRGQNLDDPTESGDYFEITRKGRINFPYQLKCSAYLPRNTARVTGNNIFYFLGTTVPMAIYKQIGTGFYVGNGSGVACHFECNETPGTFGFFLNVYGVVAVGPVPAGQTLTSIDHYDASNNLIRRYQSFCAISPGVSNVGANVTKGLDMKLGEKVRFGVMGGLIGEAKTIYFLGISSNTITTYIDIYKIG